MPKETVNRRVQFTKTALRDAMIELICEKPLTSITVKDVCARADINRSTFYLHYKDVDSLLVAVEDYAIEYIQSHFKGLGNAFRFSYLYEEHAAPAQSVFRAGR